MQQMDNWALSLKVDFRPKLILTCVAHEVKILPNAAKIIACHNFIYILFIF